MPSATSRAREPVGITEREDDCRHLSASRIPAELLINRRQAISSAFIAVVQTVFAAEAFTGCHDGPFVLRPSPACGVLGSHDSPRRHDYMRPAIATASARATPVDDTRG